MAWLKEQGIISSYFDYRRLPVGVLDDARMMSEGVAHQQKQEAQRGRRR